MAATPANVRNWIEFITVSISNALGVPLPFEPTWTLDAPLVATDDPTNGVIHIGMGGPISVVNATATSGTTVLTNSTDFYQPFDCTAGSVIVAFPSGTVGQKCLAVDVSAATSATHTITFTGTGGVKVQHPDTLALSVSQTFTSQRNFTFARVTGPLGDFWAAT
jgi:hypothetical protein